MVALQIQGGTDCGSHCGPELVRNEERGGLRWLTAGEELERSLVSRTTVVFPLGWCSFEQLKQTGRTACKILRAWRSKESLAFTSE